MRRRIMRSDAHQAQMEQDGFILIEGLLSKSEIDHLLDFYAGLESDLDQPFHATIHSKLPDFRRKVSQEINRIFTPKVSEYLLDYKEVFSNFTVKEPDPNSNFEMHLDWTMVDEKKFSSVTTWCPLMDITDENSYLWVLRGSHLFDYTIRGGPGLHIQTDKEYGADIGRKFETWILKLKAGSCYIYDHRIFHGSPANRSDKTRIAINHTMIPGDTESWHYQFRGDEVKDRVEIMEVDQDFYNRHILFEEPQGVKSLGLMNVKPNFLTQEQVDSLYEKVGAKEVIL